MNRAEDVWKRSECDTKTVTTPTPVRYTLAHRLYIPWLLSQMSVLNSEIIFIINSLWIWQKGFSICFVNALCVIFTLTMFFLVFIVLFLCLANIYHFWVSRISSSDRIFPILSFSSSLYRSLFLPHTFFITYSPASFASVCMMPKWKVDI